jgi:hypothetical protein
MNWIAMGQWLQLLDQQRQQNGEETHSRQS